MTFAVKGQHGAIQVRALPSREVAERIRVAQYPAGKVVIDPRSVAR